MGAAAAAHLLASLESARRGDREQQRLASRSLPPPAASAPLSFVWLPLRSLLHRLVVLRFGCCTESESPPRGSGGGCCAEDGGDDDALLSGPFFLSLRGVRTGSGCRSAAGLPREERAAQVADGCCGGGSCLLLFPLPPPSERRGRRVGAEPTEADDRERNVPLETRRAGAGRAQALLWTEGRFAHERPRTPEGRERATARSWGRPARAAAGRRRCQTARLHYNTLEAADLDSSSASLLPQDPSSSHNKLATATRGLLRGSRNHRFRLTGDIHRRPNWCLVARAAIYCFIKRNLRSLQQRNWLAISNPYGACSRFFSPTDFSLSLSI